MYLSRLMLNLKARTVQRDIADCQSLHRRVMGAFGQAPPRIGVREHFGVLYRLDERRDKAALLVQSHVAPDWSRLPDDYLDASVTENPAVKGLTNLYDGITDDLTLSFRLRANVTRRVAKSSKRGDETFKEEWRGKRVEIWGEDDQLAWLSRKGKAAGFEILTARVNGGKEHPAARANPNGKIWGRRNPQVREGQERKTRMTFGGVTFEGLLRVTDAPRLREAIAKGIGPAKAYGFGLLSVAPPR